MASTDPKEQDASLSVPPVRVEPRMPRSSKKPPATPNELSPRRIKDTRNGFAKD